MALPSLLNRKIYKTGQTRGADDDVIFQNRVGRNSTVLIPFPLWSSGKFIYPDDDNCFENGHIILILPSEYFGVLDENDKLNEYGLELGKNCLIIYETRKEWNEHNPENLGWKPATSRQSPLGGQYVARVPANTSEGGVKISQGYTHTTLKGAGIRVYEYASSETIANCRLQLEAIYWHCSNSAEIASLYGMSLENSLIRKQEILDTCTKKGLLDYERLRKSRMIDMDDEAVCPLCLEKLSAQSFFSRMVQAEGRVVPDLTVTEVNLFHIEELRVGIYNHKPYNLGWGHHHCNVVVKDAGITPTLVWMHSVIERNKEFGFLADSVSE